MAKKRKLTNKSPVQPKQEVEEPIEEEPIEEPIEEEPIEEEQQQQQEEDHHEEEEQQTLDAAPSQDSVPEGDEDVDVEEPILKLLEPFTKQQLIDLLNETANTHSDVRDRIKTLADVDPVHRKVFVHGLGWDTTVETLMGVFGVYGEIEDCKHVCDKASGKSKGYAFILFKHRSGAHNALKEPQKKIGSRMTSCQLAVLGPVAPPGPVPAGPPASEYTQKKIFVSNVSSDVDPQKLLSFFSKYGEIVEGPLGLDKQTGKPKGFALFVYKTVESAKKALDEPHKNFEGHTLHCQRAIDGPKSGKTSYQPSSSNYARNGNGSGGAGLTRRHEVGVGQGMVSPVGVPFNQPPSQLNPMLGQAITALLASTTQNGGLGLTNLLGQLGSAGATPSVPPAVNNAAHGMQGGYGNQSMGSNIHSGVYGNQSMGSGYPNYQMGYGNTGRSQHGGGYIGGGKPY